MRRRPAAVTSRLLLVLVVSGAVSLAPAARVAEPQSRVSAPPSLRQLAQRMVAAGAPGALVYVRDGAGARARTAGYANLRTKEPLRARHAFRIGSVTKTFVATVVLQLEAEGVLRLDDPLERWLPGLVPNGGAITLRQLLSHTSGIYNYTADSAFIRSVARHPRAGWTPAALVAIATAHRPRFAPGTDWAYSNTGYILLGLVVESATGERLAAELGRRIFQPLGLSRTSLPAGTGLAAPFARGYVPPRGLIATRHGRPADITAWNASSAWAAGAIVSTAADLARFYAGLLGGELLAPSQLAELETIASTREAYGLGIERKSLACGDAWGHGGAVPGFRTLAFSSEDGSRQAIAMVNISVGDAFLGSRFGAGLESAFCRT